MTSLIFTYHKEMLLSVRRAKVKGVFINAKPILLISILDAYSLGILSDNKVKICGRLIELYNINSKNYQPEIKLTPFYKPFFHLTSDRFWTLKLNDGYSFPEHNKTPTFKWQKEAIEYAYFSDSLFESIVQNSDREKLKEAIIQHFFKKNN
jgi:predicted restriction endonuclease